MIVIIDVNSISSTLPKLLHNNAKQDGGQFWVFNRQYGD